MRPDIDPSAGGGWLHRRPLLHGSTAPQSHRLAAQRPTVPTLQLPDASTLQRPAAAVAGSEPELNTDMDTDPHPEQEQDDGGWLEPLRTEDRWSVRRFERGGLNAEV